ncbi:MAG: MBL fold metallo-hydrolase [Planctomycetota bacterium]
MSETPTDRPTVEAFPLGMYQTNCYIVRGTPAGGGSGLFVVDCGQDPEPLLARLDELGGAPEVWLLTHAHLDHIGGLYKAREKFPETPIWIHSAEEHWLQDAEANLSAFGPMPTTAPPPDRTLQEGETLTLAGFEWKVLHVPGHSPGSAAYVCESAGLCFGGDALFAGSIGRTDFPGCSMEQLSESIKTRLYTLPDETAVLPGHGPATTIGREQATNPFVQG